MKVLLVEDDTFFSRRISEELQDSGVEVAVVASAEEAVSTDANTLDGAVIDVMLPNNAELSGISIEESRAGFLTGVAVARRLLKNNPKIKIVMMSSDSEDGAARRWARMNKVAFVLKHEGYRALVEELSRAGIVQGNRTPASFIVHGHDSASLFELKNYIQNNLKWQEPVVLREQPSLGRTIIEKFEDYARPVGCVFVLMTPDDLVIAGKTNEERRRARQNVIFELGFFYGALNRTSGRVLVLHKGNVDLPSDIDGVIWVDISNGVNSAGEEIRKELAGL